MIKEIAAAKNIKDRSNRQNVQRLLTILNQRLTNINFNIHYLLGLFCFIGINEYGEEIIELIEPNIKLDLFYYSCSNKFIINIIDKYIKIDVDGAIIFVNGNECFGYKFINGQFVKIFGLNGNLVKRHKKGGFSANRFARIAEESRHLYIIRICDRLKELNSLNTILIYGSDEMVEMTMKLSPIKLIYGGFLNFNSNTILNTKYWLEILSKSHEKNYDDKYEEILNYLAINPDILDFNPSNKDNMKYFFDKLSTDSNKFKSNQIPLISSSKYYSQLVLFEYIGVKYFDNQISDDLDIFDNDINDINDVYYDNK